MGSVSKSGIAVAGVALAALAGARASAQEPPPDGGTRVGGSVPSYLELALTAPRAARFPSAAGVHELTIRADVTASDAPTLLSVADGDATAGPRRGHLGRLARPLEAAVGTSAFQSLDASVDPLLARWGRPVTHTAATVRLRQRIDGRAGRASYRKLLLVTIAPDSP